MKETHILFVHGTASTRDTEDDTNNRRDLSTAELVEAGEIWNLRKGLKEFESSPKMFCWRYQGLFVRELGWLDVKRKCQHD